MLIGILLNAESIFSFSGQFIIGNKYETNPMIDSATYEQRTYYDLRPLVEKYKGSVYYFCPYNCYRDQIQFDHVSDVASIVAFKCKSAMHGQTIIPNSIQYFLYAERKDILKLYERYNGKIINEKWLVLRTNGIRKGSHILIKRYLKRIWKG